MKYMMTIIETFGSQNYNVTTTPDDEVFTSFPAEIGNPNYDQFLLQVELSDEEVKALPTNEWFEV